MAKDNYDLIITITGKAGSEKSTLAGFITEQLDKHNIRVELKDSDSLTYMERASNIENLENFKVKIITKKIPRTTNKRV